MLMTAFLQLMIALMILLWSHRIDDSRLRFKIEIGVFFQFLLAVGLVVVYLVY